MTSNNIIGRSAVNDSSSGTLRLIDRKDGTCSEFRIYTDDLPTFQEYAQAHNTQKGVFTGDIQSSLFQR